MPGSRCICPECDAVFRLDANASENEKITCPKCDAVFRIPDTEEFEDRPRRRARPAPSRMKPAMVLLIAIPFLLGAVGLVGGAGWLIWKIVQMEKDDQAVKTVGPGTTAALPPLGRAGGNPPPQPEAPAPGVFDIGAVAPEIQGEDLDGNRFKLSDYRGKVVVLDFWGHW